MKTHDDQLLVGIRFGDSEFYGMVAVVPASLEISELLAVLCALYMEGRPFGRCGRLLQSRLQSLKRPHGASGFANTHNSIPSMTVSLQTINSFAENSTDRRTL